MGFVEPTVAARIHDPAATQISNGFSGGACLSVQGRTYGLPSARFMSPKICRRLARQRRGVVALWLILSLPVLAILLCVVVEIGNIWLARVELENALEAAALAAVKQWKDDGGGSTAAARQVANTYSQANTVTGTPVVLDTTVGSLTNDNHSCDGDLIFGAVTHMSSPYVLDAGEVPGCNPGDPGPYGVRAQKSQPVNSVCVKLFGRTLPTFQVSASATAMYDCASLHPRLIRVRPANVFCP